MKRRGKKSITAAVKENPAEPVPIKSDHSSSTNEFELNNPWQEELVSEEDKTGLYPVLSRTSMLIRDYVEFKAARRIQTAIRGWFVRHMLRKRQRAALIIQTRWRGFAAQRHFFCMLEDHVQRLTFAHYHNAATLIQKVFRGWWVREYIHDHFRLARMRISAAEELLRCVALKLHHLLRTQHIPGIYSLRNTNCLSKVEKLLAAMTYKQCNVRIRRARNFRVNRIEEVKSIMKKSAYSTQIPYSGPDFSGICEQKCTELMKELDTDKKLHKILSLYHHAMNEEEANKTKRTITHKKSSNSKIKKDKETRSDFCVDVINSMNRWNILSRGGLTLNKNIFLNPENVASFIDELQGIYNDMRTQCTCFEQPFMCPPPAGGHQKLG